MGESFPRLADAHPLFGMRRVSFRLFARLLWLGMLLLACAYLLLLEVSVRRGRTR